VKNEHYFGWQERRKKWQRPHGGVIEMAKPIEFELHLHGEDARAFQEYMDSPADKSSPEARDIMREAVGLSKRLDRILL